MELQQAPSTSFSIILETENLANANLKGLYDCLNSLEHQEISPESANEVLLIESGDTPPKVLEELCQKYPWIQVHHADSNIGYYEAKMLGASLATGNIIVYCDSDCIYEKSWLGNLLNSFSQSGDVSIVAGETKTRDAGIYGTAMALTYIFPQFSGEKNKSETLQYFLNNVAFRREFLLNHPIPLGINLYRGNCVIHADNLRHSGYKIWRQPQARATHAPPSEFSHYFWRFLLIGHDYYWQNKLLKKPLNKSKLNIFQDRISKMIAANPVHIIYLPLAIPIIITSVLLIYFGYLITSLRPNYLLDKGIGKRE